MPIEKVYIQKEKMITSNGTTTASPVFDPSAAPVLGTRNWGYIFTNDIPFVMFSETKDLYSNDWYDEQGLEEYADEANGLMRKYYDMDVKWIYKGNKYTANSHIRGFLNYLSGKDGTGVWFKLFCSWTRIGRRHVRLLKVDNNAEIVRDGNGDIIVFKTTLRVCDPVTDIILSL